MFKTRPRGILISRLCKTSSHPSATGCRWPIRPFSRSAVQPQIQNHIDGLTAEIKALAKLIKDHIHKHPDLRQKRDLFQSVPGLFRLSGAIWQGAQGSGFLWALLATQTLPPELIGAGFQRRHLLHLWAGRMFSPSPQSEIAPLFTRAVGRSSCFSSGSNNNFPLRSFWTTARTRSTQQICYALSTCVLIATFKKELQFNDSLCTLL